MANDHQDPSPSQDEQRNNFATMLVAALRKAGEQRAIYYDEPAFKLSLGGEDRTFWIGNFFVEFCRTKVEGWQDFFTSACSIWLSVQSEWPKVPWIKQILHPVRDETHVLSYRVVAAPGTHLWQVIPPGESPSNEYWDLPAAYGVWLNSQYQRGNIEHYRRLHDWISAGQIDTWELQVVFETRRVITLLGSRGAISQIITSHLAGEIK